MKQKEPISIYIHIPFCVRKCAYCDFTSYAGAAAHAQAYVEAVCREMRAQAAFFASPSGGEKRRVLTVFLGGGTPTLLAGEQVRALLDTLRACFDLAPDAEITMEGNPGTLTAGNLAAYRAAGVTRLSLGVQSFDDGLLKRIGRIHSVAQAVTAVCMAREAGFENINLDLMNGLPGQTPRLWADTLERAIALRPAHLSCYNLILEEGTPLFEAAKNGQCAPLPDEDAMEEIDAITQAHTSAAGFAQYEVSNYARPGFECRHNLVYWECLPYLGLGCAAHSDMDGQRFFNPDELDAYFSLVSGGGKRPQEGDARERRFERVMMGLRMTRGVDAARFARDFGQSPEAVWPESIARMVDGGFMARSGERLRLTPRGMRVMNALLVTMMEEEERRG